VKADGAALITTCKRFAIRHIIRAAQKTVQGTALDALQIHGEEFASKDYLADMIIVKAEMGTKQCTYSQVKCGGELRERSKWADGFHDGPFPAMVRSNSTDEENTKWPEAISNVAEVREKVHEGLLMAAWIIIATK
jgi:hypothetical protein